MPMDSGLTSLFRNPPKFPKTPELDPYETSTPGYGGIVGSTPQWEDQMGWFNNNVPQAVINSLLNSGAYLTDVSESGQYWGAGWNPEEQAVGGGGGGYIQQPATPGKTEEPIEWILGDYDVGGQGPDWWRPFTVKNKEHFSNPMVGQTLMMNALIGSGALSEEDARSMAQQLAIQWETKTGDNPWDLYSTKFGARGDILGSPTMQQAFDPMISREQMLLGQTGPGVIDENARFGQDRARQVVDALSAMREATVGGNIDKLGLSSGYSYLQELAQTMSSVPDSMANTRAEKQQIMGAMDPLMAMSGGGELAAFSQMAQALASPFYTNLPPEISRTQAGDYQYGRQSKHLFF